MSNLRMNQLAPGVIQAHSTLAGRVKVLYHNWEMITQDQWVLECIQGVMF